LISVLNDVEINTTLDVVEEVNTSVSTNKEQNVLKLYPNPTTDRLYFDITGTGPINLVVLNAMGQRVLASTMVTNNVDVSSLPAGVYVLQASRDGRSFQASFSKE
jgi:hypothetical protein